VGASAELKTCCAHGIEFGRCGCVAADEDGFRNDEDRNRVLAIRGWVLTVARRSEVNLACQSASQRDTSWPPSVQTIDFDWTLERYDRYRAGAGRIDGVRA
jgi:hypothetical protein